MLAGRREYFATGLDRLFDHRKSGAFTGGHSTSVTSGLRLFINIFEIAKNFEPGSKGKARPVHARAGFAFGTRAFIRTTNNPEVHSKGRQKPAAQRRPEQRSVRS